MFGCHLPIDLREGGVQGLADKAMKVSSVEATRVEEFNRISYVFKKNGYPNKYIEKAIGNQVRRRSLDQAVPKGEATADDDMQTVRIPFIEGLSQEIRRVARKCIRCAFYLPNTLKSLYSTKDRLLCKPATHAAYAVS